MSGLLGSRAWSGLALLAGLTSVWTADIAWLRLGCAIGLVIGIAQQLTLLALSIRMRTLATFSVRLSAASMLSAGIACWYLANSPGLPFLIVAALLLILAALWWFCTALRNADVVQLRARNLPGVPEEPVDPPRWPYGWGWAVMSGFFVLSFVAGRCRSRRRCLQRLRVSAVAMLAGSMPYTQFTRYNSLVLDKFRHTVRC